MPAAPDRGCKLIVREYTLPTIPERFNARKRRINNRVDLSDEPTGDKNVCCIDPDRP